MHEFSQKLLALNGNSTSTTSVKNRNVDVKRRRQVGAATSHIDRRRKLRNNKIINHAELSWAQTHPRGHCELSGKRKRIES